MPSLNPPILCTSKFVTQGMTGFSYYATLLAAIDVWIQTKQGENIMIFDTEIIPMWLILLAMVFGAVLLIVSKYWYQYEDKRKHSAEPVKWNHIYTIAIVATLVCAIASSYMIVMYGLDLFFDKQVTDVGLAFLLCFIVGAVSAYFFDALFPRYLADGRLAKIYADGQEAIRKIAESEAAQKAFMDAIAKKANALGLVSENKIKALQGMVADKGAEDPNFPMYVQMLLNMPEQ